MNRGVMTGAVAIGLACLLVLGCSQKMEIPKAATIAVAASIPAFR